jgi:hypothetical protein
MVFCGINICWNVLYIYFCFTLLLACQKKKKPWQNMVALMGHALKRLKSRLLSLTKASYTSRLNVHRKEQKVFGNNNPTSHNVDIVLFSWPLNLQLQSFINSVYSHYISKCFLVYCPSLPLELELVVLKTF